MKVALFVTCLVDQAAPGVGMATVRLLEQLGCEVWFPEQQTCCGQPALNSGYPDQARQAALSLMDAFESAAYVVSPSGSCVGTIHHHYPHLFDRDPELLERARRLIDKTYELSQFLVNVLGRTELGARLETTATYHASCHAHRLLGIKEEPLQLLGQVQGLELIPLARVEDCCGFGGAFSVKLPEISATMADEKIDAIESTGAAYVVSTDVGCLLHLSGRLARRGSPVKTLHLAELLWQAMRGVAS